MAVASAREAISPYNEPVGAIVIRGILAAAIAVTVLYMADQELADGHYTGYVTKVVTKVKQAIGIQEKSAVRGAEKT